MAPSPPKSALARCTTSPGLACGPAKTGRKLGPTSSCAFQKRNPQRDEQKNEELKIANGRKVPPYRRIGLPLSPETAIELSTPAYRPFMDSPLVSRLFRQLFRHPACQPRRNFARLASSLQQARSLQASRPTASRHALHSQRHGQIRSYAAAPRGGRITRANESDWQQRTDMYPEDMSAEYAEYPMVTAQELRQRRERPRRVKMLMRDFIEGTYHTRCYYWEHIC